MDLGEEYHRSDQVILLSTLNGSTCCCSAAQSCLTLRDPMDSSTPGLPVHHQLPELAQTHVYQVSDAIKPSHPLLSPSPPVFNLSQHQGLFKMSQYFSTGGQSIGISASASVLPVNTQDWSPSEWTGWTSLQSKGLSRVFSNNTAKSINTSALSFLHSPNLPSIHDQWKCHSFNVKCQMSFIYRKNHSLE